ncbi:hypothetical protein GCM10011315_00650 [Roseovarius pacificus]|nr:hypothetical protein GCM10011315_00650 [Roseovarius pacificus]
MAIFINGIPYVPKEQLPRQTRPVNAPGKPPMKKAPPDRGQGRIIQVAMADQAMVPSCGMRSF